MRHSGVEAPRGRCAGRRWRSVCSTAIACKTHPSSPHAWLHLPARWTAEAFAAEMRSRDVLVQRLGGVFSCGSTDAARDSTVSRNGRAPAPRLEQALTRVVTALAERTPAARAVV